jgi:hemoglobin-like flavoprotein
MYIHSLFNDIGLSVSKLLDNIIIGNPNVIKRYEFNTGTRTFQLEKDYKPNFDLPVCIVSINDESVSFGQRPEVLQGSRTYNVNQIPVLYNLTNNRVLLLQEESTNVPISVTINCESQFQAKEFAHIIRQNLPTGKWISHLKFSSFLEIDRSFLTSRDFNPNEHDVINLFTKPSKTIGEVEYCFIINYQPIIRLESINASSPDTTQRTYQCQFDMTYMMQWPIYIYSKDDDKQIESLVLSLGSSRDNPITDFPTRKVLSPYVFIDSIINYIINYSNRFTKEEISKYIKQIFEVYLSKNDFNPSYIDLRQLISIIINIKYDEIKNATLDQLFQYLNSFFSKMTYQDLLNLLNSIYNLTNLEQLSKDELLKIFLQQLQNLSMYDLIKLLLYLLDSKLLQQLLKLLEILIKNVDYDSLLNIFNTVIGIDVPQDLTGCIVKGIKASAAQSERISQLDPVLLKVLNESKTLNIDPNKYAGVVRRNLIVSTEDQYPVLTDSSGNYYFTIIFDSKDFILDKRYSYNFISNPDVHLYDYPVNNLNSEDNKVTFKFDTNIWQSIKPTLTKPLLIQIFDPKLYRLTVSGV